jgi:hypothetical protein
MTRRAGRRLTLALHLLALLAAALTGVAALFLMQTLLMVLMAITFVTLLVAGFISNRRSPA